MIRTPTHEGMILCPRCLWFNILTDADANERIPALGRCHRCRLFLPLSGDYASLPDLDTMKEMLDVQR